jgi:hypothetical protein
MSYYTRVTFEFSDEPPPVESASQAVRAYLQPLNVYAVDYVLEDFRKGWTEGSTEFNGLVAQDVEGIMKAVSLAFPEMQFYVRGMGEEYLDVWLRQFENGKILHSVGPFEGISE